MNNNLLQQLQNEEAKRIKMHQTSNKFEYQTQQLNAVRTCLFFHLYCNFVYPNLSFNSNTLRELLNCIQWCRLPVQIKIIIFTSSSSSSSKLFSLIIIKKYEILWKQRTREKTSSRWKSNPWPSVTPDGHTDRLTTLRSHFA